MRDWRTKLRTAAQSASYPSCHLVRPPPPPRAPPCVHRTDLLGHRQLARLTHGQFRLNPLYSCSALHLAQDWAAAALVAFQAPCSPPVTKSARSVLPASRILSLSVVQLSVTSDSLVTARSRSRAYDYYRAPSPLIALISTGLDTQQMRLAACYCNE